MHSTRRRWPSLPPGWRLPTQPPSDRTHLTPGRAETPQGADRPQVRGGTGMEQDEARLRRAPAERFAGTEHVYNLAEIAAQLRAEPEGFNFPDSWCGASSMRSPLAEGAPCCSRLVYFLVRCLLGVGSRRQDQNDIELLVLRHQVKVLQRQVKRPRLNRLDRVMFAATSARLPRGSWSSFVVRPETLLRWHRELVRKKWTYRRMGQPGRPPIEPDARALVVRLGRENPRWGYQRIRGELLKLGIRISATTVRTILLRSGLNPAPRRTGPTWT